MSGGSPHYVNGRCWHCGLPLDDWDAHADGKGYRIQAGTASAPAKPARRLAWVVIVAMLLALGGLGLRAAYAPPAYAASSWYMHNPDSGNATIAFVQAASQTETAASTTISVNITSNPGDLLFVVVASPTTGVSSITDSAGNGYQCTCQAGNGTSFVVWKWASHANAVTSVTANLSASAIATMYVLEFSGVNTAGGAGNINSGLGTNASPTTNATTPLSAGAAIVGMIQSPATVTYSAGPSFTSGTTNNQAKLESTGGGSTEDLIVGYDLPGSASSQNYSGTYTASAAWSSAIVTLEPAGNTLDNAAPTGSSTSSMTMITGQQQVWETGSTAGSQTVAAGTYTFTYWTSNPNGPAGSATATLTFGYSATATCNSITALASWSASFSKGQSGATTSTTTGSSATIPANSYICWQVAVTANSGNTFALMYDTTTFQTKIDTPDITVPEFGLALLGVALVVPLVGRRRLRDWLPILNRPATHP